MENRIKYMNIDIAEEF